MYYPSSENKGADQLCTYCTADLRLCFGIGKNLCFTELHFQHGLFSLILRDAVCYNGLRKTERKRKKEGKKEYIYMYCF